MSCSVCQDTGKSFQLRMEELLEGLASLTECLYIAPGCGVSDRDSSLGIHSA